MNTDRERMEQAANDAVIKVIGVGGGGINAIEHMVMRGLSGVALIGADMNARAQDGYV
ncbi:MAG: hypothetical protein FWF41_00980 [Betaproteobacteria bacterium]|nr:hypothetical protein [Betaproteobacteria bacterium]